MVFVRRQRTLDWDDAGAVKKQLTTIRAALPDAEAAAVAATAALDGHLARRELVGIGVSVARRQALVAGADMRAERDPLNPAEFILVSQDASDEASATLRQREALWEAAAEQEGRLRVGLTSANERRGALRTECRRLTARLEQLAAEAAGPAPRRERPVPNWQTAVPKGA